MKIKKSICYYLSVQGGFKQIYPRLNTEDLHHYQTLHELSVNASKGEGYCCFFSDWFSP